MDIGAYEFQNPTSIISYEWLLQHGLPTDGSADQEDPDGDGMSNYKEWICGTDPFDPTSLLQVFPLARSQSGINVTWQSVSGIRTYFIQRSTNLTAHPAFTSVVTNVTGSVGTIRYTDTNAIEPDPFFYRVGVQH